MGVVILNAKQALYPSSDGDEGLYLVASYEDMTDETSYASCTFATILRLVASIAFEH
jgi:hypothetical protein